MQHQNLRNYILSVLENMPSDWLNLTTHRLDIYNEALAKTEFTEAIDDLYSSSTFDAKSLQSLPTAYDYIRLGHPLSCVLEWSIAKIHNIHFQNVISFASQTMPIMAILRTNALEDKNTLIAYTDGLPESFDTDILKTVYGYHFELQQVEDQDAIPEFDGSVIFVSEHDSVETPILNPTIDFYINLYPQLGSILVITDVKNNAYASAIQHVRRRETIAMTPINTLVVLKALASESNFQYEDNTRDAHKAKVLETVASITNTTATPLVASSGLSMQYAIMMGLIHHAQEHHPNKAIKFLVPPNCYGGTNDQARRVVQSIGNVAVLDLPVDGDNDMVSSIDTVLDNVAQSDAIPYIIAEIPTNPRVEVPDLDQLKAVLTKTRQTANGTTAIAPVFILDQTFCPNVDFLGENGILSQVQSISYASGSKFPSGGKCTAGYAVVNQKAEMLLPYLEKHLSVCDNEATLHQYHILAEQLPSMNQRIAKAYENTRELVNFIKDTLPNANINFVSDDLAKLHFTPSVFSLDLPTQGETHAEKESYKRALNLKLINLMITKIPNESKYCVSYGQLKGCYWTIPATSTQGTTKEGDKDYIVRVSVSPNLDLEQHKAVFKEFVAGI